MKIKFTETFAPLYNSVEQVKECAFFMIQEKIKEARVAIVIGHNGKNFVSSTDWRLITESGVECVLPFSARPQYPTFVECVASVNYLLKNGKFCVMPDYVGKPFPHTAFGWSQSAAEQLIREKTAVVKIGDEIYHFKAGEKLIIYVEPDSRFIATDCAVKLKERGSIRIFEVVTDENTKYGLLNKAGVISPDW